MDIYSLALYCGQALDIFGVVIVVIGVIIATSLFIFAWMKRSVPFEDIYKSFRRNLGRVILLGLELLVAGDIIRSVVGKPSFLSVAVLAIIVLIRSFLSITFEMEVDGRWPWQKRARNRE